MSNNNINKSLFVAIFFKEEEPFYGDNWAFIYCYKLPTGRGLINLINATKGTSRQLVCNSIRELIYNYGEVKTVIETGRTVPPSFPGKCIYEGQVNFG